MTTHLKKTHKVPSFLLGRKTVKYPFLERHQKLKDTETEKLVVFCNKEIDIQPPSIANNPEAALLEYGFSTSLLQ